MNDSMTSTPVPEQATFDEMRRQIMLLKQKLNQTCLVNEKLIKQSARNKLNDLQRKRRRINCIILFGLLYCNGMFSFLDYSFTLMVLTTCFLLAAYVYQHFSSKGIRPSDMARCSLVEISHSLLRMDRLNQRWLYFSIPFVIGWFALFLYESYTKSGGPYICCGGAVGFVIGAVLGIIHFRHVRRKTREAVREIEDFIHGQ